MQLKEVIKCILCKKNPNIEIKKRIHKNPNGTGAFKGVIWSISNKDGYNSTVHQFAQLAPPNAFGGRGGKLVLNDATLR